MTKNLSSMKLQDFIEFVLQTLELGPSPVPPIMRCLFIEQSKLLQFHWKSKQENYFFPQLTISITRIQTKKKTGLRVAAVTLLSWCKLRRGNNQPTRINLLINFNSSREEPVEPGGCISSVRGVQGQGSKIQRIFA